MKLLKNAENSLIFLRFCFCSAMFLHIDNRNQKTIIDYFKADAHSFIII